MSRRRRQRYESWYPPYVSVGERRAQAAKAARTMAGKMDLKPVCIRGSKLAGSWWGMEWNANLERYSDYSNRLPRGRSYVRHGSVIHLDIQPGQINALVQGSRAEPYQVKIQIARLNAQTWQRMIAACADKLDSVQDLIAGKFPADLASMFTEKGSGLFPAPREIELSCSCPDWAVMCKHVAATLYGVGSRLDETPALFFTLRQVDQDQLVAHAVRGMAEELSRRAERTSDRVLKDEDLGSVFGIAMDGIDFEMPDPGPEYQAGEFIGDSARLSTGADDDPPTSKRKRKSPRPAAAKARDSRSPETPTMRRQPAPASESEAASSPRTTKRKGTRKAKPAASPSSPPTGSLIEQLTAALADFPNGATAFDLVGATNWKEAKVRNTIARGLAQGAIVSPRRGLYVLADA